MTGVQICKDCVKYWNGVGRKNGTEERKSRRAERWNGRKTERTE